VKCVPNFAGPEVQYLNICYLYRLGKDTFWCVCVCVYVHTHIHTVSTYLILTCTKFDLHQIPTAQLGCVCNLRTEQNYRVNTINTDLETE